MSTDLASALSLEPVGLRRMGCGLTLLLPFSLTLRIRPSFLFQIKHPFNPTSLALKYKRFRSFSQRGLSSLASSTASIFLTAWLSSLSHHGPASIFLTAWLVSLKRHLSHGVAFASFSLSHGTASIFLTAWLCFLVIFLSVRLGKNISPFSLLSSVFLFCFLTVI